MLRVVGRIFDRYVAMQALITRAIHFAHTARAIGETTS